MQLKQRFLKLFRLRSLAFLIVTTAFTLGFYNNFWGTVDQQTFQDFDSWCKSQVVGRLIKAQHDGVFSDGGFNGWVIDGPAEKIKRPELHNYQFEIYLNDLDVDTSKFKSYISQVGGQAMFYASIGKLLPWSNRGKLQFYIFLTAVSFAIILSLFLQWVYVQFNLSTAILTAIFLLLTPWLVLFGNGIYWVMAVFFLPFVSFLRFFQKEARKETRVKHRTLFMYAFLLILLKLFFTGFEYMSPTLVMCTIPLFYYGFLNSWKPSLFFKRFAATALGSVSALVLYIVLFAFQAGIKAGGTWTKGLKYILGTFSKRTTGFEEGIDSKYRASLEAGHAEVLQTYWDKVAFDFTQWLNTDLINFYTIDFGELLLILIIASVLCFSSKRLSPSLFANQERNIALMKTTWVAMLAPLSWFIIFKGHSYVHTAYNAITWYMPFALMGFALMSSVGTSLVKDALVRIKELPRNQQRIILASTIIITLTFMTFHVQETLKKTRKYQQVIKEGNELYHSSTFKIITYRDTLWYINENASKRDKTSRVFIHVKPVDLDDLPESRRQYGFVNLDFNIDKNNKFQFPLWSGKKDLLFLYQSLPDYRIDSLRTGQYEKKEIFWDTSYIPFNTSAK